MGLLDILRGQRAPRRADLDRIFAISTSLPTLTVNLGLRPTGRAGVCFRPVEAAAFADLVRDVDGLLELAGRSSGTTSERVDDELGFSWIVLGDEEFDDLVTAVHLINSEIEGRGFSEQLLCSVFGFRDADDRTVDLVYAYKRASFYPFAPTGKRARDNATEMRLAAALESEMPIEKELERWYPVWDAPVSAPG